MDGNNTVIAAQAIKCYSSSAFFIFIPLQGPVVLNKIEILVFVSGFCIKNDYADLFDHYIWGFVSLFLLHNLYSLFTCLLIK